MFHGGHADTSLSTAQTQAQARARAQTQARARARARARASPGRTQERHASWVSLEALEASHPRASRAGLHVGTARSLSQFATVLAQLKVAPLRSAPPSAVLRRLTPAPEP
jgi:hypothetical protein